MQDDKFSAARMLGIFEKTENGNAGRRIAVVVADRISHDRDVEVLFRNDIEVFRYSTASHMAQDVA